MGSPLDSAPNSEDTIAPPSSVSLEPFTIRQRRIVPPNDFTTIQPIQCCRIARATRSWVIELLQQLPFNTIPREYLVIE